LAQHSFCEANEVSVTDTGLWITEPVYVEAAADPELVAETIGLARVDCPVSGQAYLLDDPGIERWDEVARAWNPELPTDFKFNRVRRLYTQVGQRVLVGEHRDHPDFQGEVDILGADGNAEASVQGIGKLTLSTGGLLRLVAWPVGESYPGGRPYQAPMSNIGNPKILTDPRTGHQLRYEGPREAIMLVYDANPTNPKEKYT
jgi:hypothetical protein